MIPVCLIQSIMFQRVDFLRVASCEPSCFARKVSSVSPRSAKIWRLYPSQVTMQHGLSIQKLAKGKRWKMRRNAKRRCFREVAMTHLTWRRSWMLLMNCMGQHVLSWTYTILIPLVSMNHRCIQTHFSQLNWNLKGLQFCGGCRFQSMLPQWSNKRICISRFLIQIYCKLDLNLTSTSVLLGDEANHCFSIASEPSRYSQCAWSKKHALV